MKYIHNLLCLIVVVLSVRSAELIGLRTDVVLTLLGILFYLIVRKTDRWDEKFPWLYQKGEYIINYLTISVACLFLAILNGLLGIIARFSFDLVIFIILALGLIIFSLIGVYQWIRICIRSPRLSNWALYMVAIPAIEIIVMAVMASFLPF